MKGTKEKDCSSEWWEELNELCEQDKNLNWCCRLVLESGFDVYVQNEIGTNVALRFALNYCPHCGTAFSSEETLIESRGCCYLFRDLGLEGMQFEEPCMKENDEADLVIHRIMMNHCFNCGRKIDRTPGNDLPEDMQGGAGECDGCDEC